MDDVNEFLRFTKTAVGDGGKASEEWIRRGKKRTAAQSTDDSGNVQRGDRRDAHKNHSTESKVGLDMTQLRDDMARARAEESAHTRQRNAATLLHRSHAAAQMAQRVMHHVMVRQLGGRQNALSFATSTSKLSSSHAYAESVPDYNAMTAMLCVERSRLAPRAYDTVHHVLLAPSSSPAALRASSGSRPSLISATTAAPVSPVLLLSIVKSWPCSDAMMEYRKSLRVCSVACDLVGGIATSESSCSSSSSSSASVSAYTRHHLLAVVRAGLRGESWSRPGYGIDEEGKRSESCHASLRSEGADSAGTELTAKKVTLNLFKQDVVRHLTDTQDEEEQVNLGGGGKVRTAHHVPLSQKSFSVSTFLDASLSSSSDDEEL